MKLADVAPAAIVTADGTVTAVLLDDVVMIAPPAGAGPERLTVHALESPPATVAGKHATEDRVLVPEEPVMFTVKVAAPPPPITFSTTMAPAVPGRAVAVNVVESAPDGTVTLGGRAKYSLPPKVTVIPPEGAGDERLTVHIVEPPTATELGLQYKFETDDPLPPPPPPPPPPEPPMGVMVREVPVGSTPAA